MTAGAAGVDAGSAGVGVVTAFVGVSVAFGGETGSLAGEADAAAGAATGEGLSSVFTSAIFLISSSDIVAVGECVSLSLLLNLCFW